MSSIFSKIIAGEIPSYKVGETDKVFAFLDINPLKLGHTLVVPKVEVDKITDLDKETYLSLMDYCQTLGKAIEMAFDCKRVGMAVVGLEVPHVHVHLVPINEMKDISFEQPKLSFAEEEMHAAVAKIKAYL